MKKAEASFTASAKNNDHLWSPGYIYSIIVLFLCHMAPYLLLSVISLFAKQLTGSDANAGMMASVFAVSGLVARFLSAALLEKFSYKKVMITSMSIMAMASFAYIFCNNYWMAFILRGIQGLGYCVAVTAMSTYIVRIIPVTKRLEGIGYSSLTASAAGILGPLIAFELIGDELNHFRLLFIVVFCTALCAVIALFFLKDILPERQKETVEKKQESIPWKKAIIPFVILLIVSLAMSPISSLLALYGVELGFGGIGTYFTISALGLLLSRFTMSYIVNRLGNWKSAILFSTMMILGLLALSAIHSLWQLMALGLLLGYAQGALSPLINTILVNSLPDSKNNVSNALFYAAGDIGFILGPTLWGVVAGITGYATVFRLAALSAIPTIILAILAMMGKRE